MKLPGGGDCDGMTAAVTTSCETGPTLAGRKASATAVTAMPLTAGVTTAGGIWGPAAQQVRAEDPHGMLICMQQLCAACCAGSTHVPTENSNTPIKTMATAVRWLSPRNIVSDYHTHTISL